jgi:hypothetical protein
MSPKRKCFYSYFILWNLPRKAVDGDEACSHLYVSMNLTCFNTNIMFNKRYYATVVSCLCTRTEQFSPNIFLRLSPVLTQESSQELEQQQ